jgi:ABC-type sugar transport system ATPase subunit
MSENILEMKNIFKHFPGVQALDNVSFQLKEGEIRALVGQNGAGKSTLLKTLGGIYKADQGEIIINGQKATNWSPREVMDQGVSFIYQELNLIPDLSIAQNICLGRETKNRLGVINWKILSKKAKAILEFIGIFDLDVNWPLTEISVAQQQMVAIAKALYQDPKVLILDEPTSRLSKDETEHLFAILTKMAGSGISIIYVSHRLEEIYRIATTVTVLRDGRLIGTHLLTEFSKTDLIQEMLGERVGAIPQSPIVPEENPICLKVTDLEGKGVKSVSFSVKTGEIVGIVGAVGAGKTEMLRLLFGLDRPTAGSVEIEQEEVFISTPKNAVNLKIALCPEDRKAQGLLLDSSVAHNISLAALIRISTGGIFISQKKENTHAQEIVRQLNIVTPSINHHSRNLSGGNQQKVVLAKWLSTDSKVFLFDEPTVGVDVKGKVEIYQLMGSLAKEGAGIVFVTSDPEEAWQVCSRILVMFGGTITKEVYPKNLTLDKLIYYVMGGTE